jgi:hypothetical protein
MTRAAQVPVEAPIGDYLGRALSNVRAVVVSFAEALAENAEVYKQHLRLVAEHPELRARSLLKQRAYAAALVELLSGRGAERQTAVLAAEIGLACYWAGRDVAGDDPHRLPAAVDAAFARLS